MNFFERHFYGNPLYDWLAALAIGVALTLALYFAKRFLLRRLSAWAGKTVTRLDDFIVEILSGTRFLFLLIVAFYFGLQYLELPPKPTRLIEQITIIALLTQVALWGNHWIALWLKDHMNRHRDTDAAAATTVSVLGFVARVTLWSVLLLMILENLGFNITSLVASLGIGGVAVALASQSILGDIFASVVIAMDKPFVLGDFLVVGDALGTVEYIGLKTTRLRSLSGEQIVFSNAELLKNRIHNYKRMYERRVVFGFGVTYQTPPAKLEAIPSKVKEIVTAQQKTRFDRAHFKEFGDSALNFEVVYFVQDPDFNLYMDIQQAVNLALLRYFEHERIEFAYPTRTLYIERETGGAHG